jgi:hypothetical protein
MRVYSGATATRQTLALTIPIVAVAWLVTVPGVLTMSSFLAIVALLTAFGWVARRTYLNGRPVASLAQSLHDAARVESLTHPSGNR